MENVVLSQCHFIEHRFGDNMLIILHAPHALGSSQLTYALPGRHACGPSDRFQPHIGEGHICSYIGSVPILSIHTYIDSHHTYSPTPPILESWTHMSAC
jgi:hypothetical protein